MSKEEVQTVTSHFPHSNFKLMVGVLVSSKTLTGHANHRPNRYPEIDRVQDIFTDDPRCLNLVHYNTDEPDTLLYQLGMLDSLVGENCHGYQLNMHWPGATSLDVYLSFRERNLGSNRVLVIQIGSQAMKATKAVSRIPRLLTPKEIQANINQYEGFADYILWDPSGGEGKALDSRVASQYLEVIYPESAKRGIGVGVAGGLCQDTLELVEPLKATYPKISIDAEGRLRTKSDHLDLESTIEYVKKAAALFEMYC